jgi:two-component system heavy metal sensor histidine kinase CusS
MSLKKSKNPHSPQSYSIITRLTLAYALTTFVMLTLTTGFLYYALFTSLKSKDERFLADKILLFRSIIKASHYEVQELELGVKEGSNYQFNKYLVKIVDTDGKVIMMSETSDMMDMLPFTPPHEVDEKPWVTGRFKSNSDEVFILMSAWAECRDCVGQKVLINTALNITVEEAILKQYRKQIYLVLFIGTLLAGICGMMIAQRGLKPLKRIAEVVQHIRASQLHERLSPAKWPQELTVLAISFDEMLDRLEDSFTRLSRFSTDIAHELRTPLNNLMGETEVALTKTRNIEEYQQILESSLEEYTRLSHMVEGLLFLARAENTDIKLDRTDVDALNEIKEVLEYYDALAEEKEIRVECNGKGVVNADPLLFRRAVTNILSNAFRYSPSGTIIHVNVQEESNQALIISISDNGIGIEVEDLNNIFERFYRTSGAKFHDTRGSGLGLAIVKSIMDLHGGTIDVQSKPTQGTTVLLSFPAKKLPQ